MTILWLYIEFEVFVRYPFENNHQAVEYLTIHDSDLDRINTGDLFSGT